MAKNRVGGLTLVFSLLLLAAVATASARPQGFARPGAPGEVLRYKPAAAADELVIETDEAVTDTAWDKTARSHRVETVARLKRTCRATADGALAVRLEVVESTTKLDGRPAPSADPGSSSESTMDPRGRAAAGGPTPDVNLVLPEGPVKPGETWDAVVPPAASFPVELKLHFKLVEYTRFLGVRCAVIEARCHKEAVVKERKCRAKVVLNSRSYFDPAAGRVLGTRSSHDVLLTYLEEVEGRPAQTATFTTIKAKAK